MRWLGLAACVFLAAVCCEAKSCSDSSECEDDECCIKFTPLGFFKGHCGKMKEEGEACALDLKDEKKSGKYYLQCPCKEGLECVDQDVPFWDILNKYKCRDSREEPTPGPDPETEPDPEPETEPEPEPDPEPET